MDTDKLLKSIEENQQSILTQQKTLMRMHDTVDVKFNKIQKQLEKFRKEWRVKKSIQKLNNRLNGMEAKDPYSVLESLRAQANVQPIRQQPQVKQTGG